MQEKKNLTLAFNISSSNRRRHSRENDVREHIPVPYDNLFQSNALKNIFGLGPMIGQAKANGHLNKIIFLPGALEMVSKETSRDPSVAVSPEKHLFLDVVLQTW